MDAQPHVRVLCAQYPDQLGHSAFGEPGSLKFQDNRRYAFRDPAIDISVAQQTNERLNNREPLHGTAGLFLHANREILVSPIAIAFRRVRLLKPPKVVSVQIWRVEENETAKK